jgi:hypothetical protein
MDKPKIPFTPVPLRARHACPERVERKAGARSAHTAALPARVGLLRFEVVSRAHAVARVGL